jgi:regulator of protease activity HflC (stomatin/prohibitin superfamily)
VRGVLDEATGRWGIRVNRLALKATDPPRTIQEAVEKQMRADRDKRGTIPADQVASSPRSSRGGREAERDPARPGRTRGADPARPVEAKAIETVPRADLKLSAYRYPQKNAARDRGRQRQHESGSFPSEPPRRSQA